MRYANKQGIFRNILVHFILTFLLLTSYFFPKLDMLIVDC